MNKIIINFELRPRVGDIPRAAKALGVSEVSVRRAIQYGDIHALGKAKRERIRIVTHLPNGETK